MSQQRRPGHSRRNPSVDIPKYTPQTHMDADAQAAHERQRALAQISDYDSENAGYTSDQLIRPTHPLRTVEQMNLSVVTRHQPEVTDILSVAPYAVIYEFETDPEPKWDKKEIEGSLFICKLTPGQFGEDRYSAVVLNRRSMKNFIAPLIDQENGGVEVNDPYVILTFIEEDVQKIYGVYIFSEGAGYSTEHSRTLNGDLMVKLANQAGLSRRSAEAAAADAHAKDLGRNMRQAEKAIPDASAANGNAPAAQQLGFEELVERQRARDADFSVRSHFYDGSISHQQTPAGPSMSSPPPIRHQQQQADVLMNLFRGSMPQQQAPQFHQPPPQNYAPSYPATDGGHFQHPYQPNNQGQPNVLADLFRRSGLPTQ